MQTLEQSLSEVSPDVRIARRAEAGEMAVELRLNRRNGFYGLVGFNLPCGLAGLHFEQYEGGLARVIATQRFEQAKRELKLVESCVRSP